ncbi:unnamed protein product [Allacma fusca]|uniref:Uncharacterized protein n=1 Tax=Allacma fusca TaxID=39272 RepID=A0A8J2PLJ6_9HEXA|nr:unnamed protein product [Allacma fusca]
MKPKTSEHPDESNATPGGGSSGQKKRRKVESNTSDSGLLKVMQQFNETNVKLQVDLITTSNDIKDQLRRLEEKLLRKVRDIEIRQEALEIVFENHEKDMEYLKNISRFQLECLNGLFQVVLQLFARDQRDTSEEDHSEDTDSESSLPAIENMEVQSSNQGVMTMTQQPPPLEAQSPTQNTDVFTFHPEAGPSQNVSGPEVNKGNHDALIPASKCIYCHRSFKMERNFLKHMQKVPKYCARKRFKMDRPC